MSQWERDKMMTLQLLKLGEIIVREAARGLDVSRRHAIRLKQRYLAGGASGLPHRAGARATAGRA